MISRFEALLFGVLGSLIGALIWVLANDWILLNWLLFKNELLIAVVFVIALRVFFAIRELIRINQTLRDTFELFKRAEELTPRDLHIVNYHRYYVVRDADSEIEYLIRLRKCVLIVGPPMLGKTRMAFEAVKKLKRFYVLKPFPKEINIRTLRLPPYRKRIILFLDDVDKFVGKFFVDELVARLTKESREFVVVATCRTGKELDQVTARKDMEDFLAQCEKHRIEPRRLKTEEEQTLAATAAKNLDEVASDGTPGSITIDLRQMRRRYEELGAAKSILKSLKLLREGSIVFWTEDLVKRTSEAVFGLDTARTPWDQHLTSLVKSGFVTKTDGRIVVSHDVYLGDEFLQDYVVDIEELLNLKRNLFEFGDAVNLFHLGNSFYQKRKREEALECYRQSVHIRPDSAWARNNLGVMLYELQRYREAEEQFTIALRFKPDDAEVHNNLATLLRDLKRSKEAEKHYRKAARLDPNHAAIRNHLGVLLYELQRYEEAERQYKKALRINPYYVEAHYNFGILLEQIGKYEEAKKQYREALRINPNLPPAHYNLGNLLHQLGSYREAEKEYRAALAAKPDFVDAYVNLGILLEKEEKYEEAEDQFKEALRIKPDYVQAHNNLANLLRRLGKWKAAEAEYREALRIDPNYAQAHYNMANLLLASNRLLEAEKELRRALEIHPHLVDARFNLGTLLVASNRKDEAREELKIARDLFSKKGREEDAKKAERLLKELES